MDNAIKSPLNAPKCRNTHARADKFSPSIVIDRARAGIYGVIDDDLRVRVVVIGRGEQVFYGYRRHAHKEETEKKPTPSTRL